MYSPVHIFLRPQEKYDEAVQLIERALSINAKALGDDHPDTVDTKNMLEAVRGQKVGAPLPRHIDKSHAPGSYGMVISAKKFHRCEGDTEEAAREGDE